LKNLSLYNNDLSVPRKSDVDAKQDKVLVDGILQGDGTGTISAVDTTEVELVELSKADVGLGNVDNTSDANKPISTATQTALDGKLSLTGGDMTGLINFDTSSDKAYQVGEFQNLHVNVMGQTMDRPCLGLTGYWRDPNGNLNLGGTEGRSELGSGSVFVTGSYVAIGTYRTGTTFHEPTSDDQATVEIHGLRVPTATYDAANKKYVDTQVATKQASITASGILKGDGSGGVTAAVAGTDYLATAPVTSVNSKTGAVSLTASDVGAVDLTSVQNISGAKTFSAGVDFVDSVDFSEATVSGLTGLLPTVTTSDNGKFLRVVNGAWAATTVASANGVSF